MEKILWGRSEPMQKRSLPKSGRTDVLIIGGGLAGIALARRLAELDVNYVLLEQGAIGSGVSGRTTAKVTAGHGFIYSGLMDTAGKDIAEAYLKANLSAVRELRRLGREFDADFEDIDSYIYSSSSERKLRDELSALRRLGYEPLYREGRELPISALGAVGFHGQGQVNPRKLIRGMAEGLNIYEGQKVRELVGNVAVTDSGRIEANRIVIATHFPFLNKHGLYYLKMYQHRTYVLAVEEATPTDAAYADGEGRGISLRNYGKYLLVGGGSHRTGKRGGGWSDCEKFVAEHYPNARISYRWATQDCMTLDRLPYAGQYSKSTPDLYVSTGFNKWGLTSSLVAASVLADGLTGRENKLAGLLSPSRSMLKPQLFVNFGEAVLGLITPAKRRCPHLGCALKWNKEEHSWDCSCHGSRFSEDGRLLDNPATGDLDK